jgi:RNA polymerase subunit RPABC4/transcription elongation factor Spt4
MQFRDRLKKGVDAAKFKADQLVRINRVQTEIAQLRSEVAAQRQKLADAALALHVAGALNQSELEALCQTMNDLNAQIALREAQIANIKAESMDSLPAQGMLTRQCPHCRSDLTDEAEFCGNCGKPTPRNLTSQLTTQATQTCTHCGQPMPSGAAFCPHCGRKQAIENDSTTTEETEE